MPDSELMSIGSFARRSGLTASALRFYADSGLLPPAEVDSISGYRFYREDQLERAVLLRQLRRIGMPLASAESVLTAERDEAVRLVDEHVDAVAGDAAATRQHAAAIKASLTREPARAVVAVSGPVLTAAIEQVLTATTYEPDLAVLNGVHVEADCGAVTLTATDRYRLSTRTLVPAEPPAGTWAATVNADDLRSCLPDLCRTPLVRVDATAHGIWMRLPERGDRHCRLLTEPFPDYRTMLAAMPPPTTRVVVPKTLLLRALEEQSADRISLRITQAGVTVLGRASAQDRGVPVPAHVTGPPIAIWFEMTTLYPAVSTAIGADVLLDLGAPDRPATVRSADHGDLTTLVMPTERQPREANTTPQEEYA
ncbi:MerR family transcriptional regulator [Prescottella agglutinans]|uniref:DNA polymerase-3 subunit beta n=1 Tax=Prescottella agglutinans TaxID=1644129 RepID=A0ABT6MCD8_9NOCA|nr:MerR family transcriptional regulator [Prescottella agglutinans]MDH6281064.1 DNA polymerase-3 subunit beta [Prescottella agglutinans]